MEYAYEKLMKENNLTLNNLNEDAINGIDSIKQVEKSINMLAKKGKNVSAKVLSKVKSNDKWICGEILQILDGKERNNTDELPFDEEEIIDQIQDEQEEQNNEIDQMESTDPIGIKIYTELDIAYMNGNTRISLEDLKNVSHTAYNVIFDNYESNTKNGVETTYFNLLETDKYIFTLTKK
jgi:hypothetical protein